MSFPAFAQLSNKRLDMGEMFEDDPSWDVWEQAMNEMKALRDAVAKKDEEIKRLAEELEQLRQAHEAQVLVPWLTYTAKCRLTFFSCKTKTIPFANICNDM